MLSKHCDDCATLKECSKRCKKAAKGEKIYCADGTAHLVDDSVSVIDFC
jgi:hypothetical protein